MDLFDQQSIPEHDAFFEENPNELRLVYRNAKEGREVFINDMYALKRFSATPSRGYQETFDQAQREFSIMQSFDHPNILRCLDFHPNPENSYCDLRLELGEGTLTNYLPYMDNSDKLLALQQICNGLEHIHQRGFVHADIKCDNVLLVKGTWKIADFGTVAGNEIVREVFRGTVHYMAPEVVHVQACSEASDVWSFGALVYHVAHGAPPFSGQEELSILYQIGTTRAMDVVREFVPQFFRTIIFLCNQENPNSRPTATYLRELLAHIAMQIST